MDGNQSLKVNTYLIFNEKRGMNGLIRLSHFEVFNSFCKNQGLMICNNRALFTFQLSIENDWITTEL